MISSTYIYIKNYDAVLFQCFCSAGNIGDNMPENNMLTFTEVGFPTAMCANFAITNDKIFTH